MTKIKKVPTSELLEINKETYKQKKRVGLPRGIFETESARTPFLKSLSEGRKPERRSGTSFHGIGITNSTPLRPNFWPLFAFRNLSQKKNGAGLTFISPSSGAKANNAWSYISLPHTSSWHGA
jgi:hypothetical protein